MKQWRESKLPYLLALPLLALAALLAAGCGKEPAVQAAQPDDEDPIVTVQYGSLDGTGPGHVSVPTHLTPRAGATLETLTPTFVWTTVSGATGYEVQVSNDPSFPSGRTIGSGIVQSPPWTSSSELEPGATYNWRTRAVFQSGAKGPWSNYSPFSLAALAMPEPSETAPAMGAIDVNPGDLGAVVANLVIWDAGSQTLMTAPGKSLAEVIRSLKKGRVYQFIATLDMVINPADFGVDRASIYLNGGKQQIVFW